MSNDWPGRSLAVQPSDRVLEAAEVAAALREGGFGVDAPLLSELERSPVICVRGRLP